MDNYIDFKNFAKTKRYINSKRINPRLFHTLFHLGSRSMETIRLLFSQPSFFRGPFDFEAALKRIGVKILPALSPSASDEQQPGNISESTNSTSTSPSSPGKFDYSNSKDEHNDMEMDWSSTIYSASMDAESETSYSDVWYYVYDSAEDICNRKWKAMNKNSDSGPSSDAISDVFYSRDSCDSDIDYYILDDHTNSDRSLSSEDLRFFGSLSTEISFSSSWESWSETGSLSSESSLGDSSEYSELDLTSDSEYLSFSEDSGDDEHSRRGGWLVLIGSWLF
eukprot:TRINITY_DN3196_c1_g1_i1.p1 TRINITY_DN3196_c1_g1~~TRINITY_DN3196_c1_g1_i1.p1  ORF type:complete len:280 (-),score=38.51 TRINITY_DN3196_c1_g1_i1:317-1156(-)